MQRLKSICLGLSSFVTRFPSFIIFLISLAVYSNSIFNGFVYDDSVLILQNPWITSIKYLPQIFFSSSWSFNNELVNTYRPLQHVLGMIEYHIFGYKPWGYHLTNVIIHAVNSVLIFQLASVIFRRFDITRAYSKAHSLPEDVENHITFLAFLSALFFAIHPIHTELVDWASAITALAMATFYILSFCLYISSMGGFDSRFLLAILAFLLAMFFKESAITLPLLIIIYDHAMDGIGLVKRRYRHYIMYFSVIAFYMAMRLYSLGGFTVKRTLPLTNYESVLNALTLFPKYIFKLIYPLGLVPNYVLIPVYSIFEWRFIFAVIFIGFYIGILLFMWRKERFIAFCLLSMVITLLPFFYLPGLGAAVFAERYLYLPSIWFVFFVVYTCSRFYMWARFTRLRTHFLSIAFITATVTLMVFYTTISFYRNFVWKDNYTLWSDAVKKQPFSYYAHLNLGTEYAKMGFLTNALKEYQSAAKLNPDDIKVHYNLGMVYFQQGAFNKAMDEFYKILKIDPYNRAAIEQIKMVQYLLQKGKQ